MLALSDHSFVSCGSDKLLVLWKVDPSHAPSLTLILQTLPKLSLFCFACLLACVCVPQDGLVETQRRNEAVQKLVAAFDPLDPDEYEAEDPS